MLTYNTTIILTTRNFFFHIFDSKFLLRILMNRFRNTSQKLTTFQSNPPTFPIKQTELISANSVRFTLKYSSRHSPVGLRCLQNLFSNKKRISKTDWKWTNTSKFQFQLGKIKTLSWISVTRQHWLSIKWRISPYFPNFIFHSLFHWIRSSLLFLERFSTNLIEFLWRLLGKISQNI